MITLYCKYKKTGLFDFMIKFSNFDETKGIELCHEHSLFKEEAYLYAKMEREQEAIEALIKNCTNLTETVDYALQFKISDMNLFWQRMI